MRRLPFRAFISIIFLFLCAGPTRAEDKCTLHRYSSVDILPGYGDFTVIPAKVNGIIVPMALTTSRTYSSLFHERQEDRRTRGDASVELSLGDLLQFRTVFLTHPEPPGTWLGKMPGGLIGVNILKEFDVEIDPVQHKVHFFSPERCNGVAVHWKNVDAVAIPMTVSDNGASVVNVTLDGRPVRALIDISAPFSLVAENVAEDLGLTKENPDGERVAEQKLRFRHKGIEIFRRQFKSLDLGPFSFKNAWIEYGNFSWRKDYDMVLGMHQLQELHLYFAFREGKLYASSVAGDRSALDVSAQNAAGGAADSQSVDTLIRQATSYADMKLYDSAIQKLDKAIRSDPRNEEAFLRRCNAHREKAEHEQALKDCSEAARINTANVVALAFQCQEAAQLGLHDQALATCNHALAIHNDDVLALSARGFTYMKMNKPELALADYDLAVEKAKDAAKPVRSYRYWTYFSNRSVAVPLYGRGLAKTMTGNRQGGSNDMGRAELIDKDVVRQYANYGFRAQ